MRATARHIEPHHHGQATALIFRLDEYRAKRATFWTEDKLAELLRLFWDEALSHGLVAKHMGITRGMVSAKLDRLGVERAKPGIDGRSFAERKPPVLELPEGLSLALWDLEPHTCRFPTREGPEGWLFCAEPQQDGSSYCAGHHAYCHRGNGK